MRTKVPAGWLNLPVVTTGCVIVGLSLQNNQEEIMTATAATAKDRGYGPHFEHAPTGEATSEWGMCPECVLNLWTIDNLAADLRDMADWPGSSDDHDDVGLLLSSFASIVEIAKQDETPELIARDLAEFLEARKTS